MWGKQADANFRETFKIFGQYQYMQSLPYVDPPPNFIELHDHLQ